MTMDMSGEGMLVGLNRQMMGGEWKENGHGYGNGGGDGGASDKDGRMAHVEDGVVMHINRVKRSGHTLLRL